MSEDFKDDSETGAEENFAELFESYSSGMKEDVQVGDKIKGKIISIGKDSVFVDTGTKVDAAVDRAELIDEDQQMPYAVGDELELYVVAADENEIRLSKAISGIGGLNLLREAFESGIPVEGKVTAPCKGGFNIEIMQRRAFCPISQMDLKYVETPEDYVGQTHQFVIKQLENKGRNIVVSRRELLARQQEKERQAFYNSLEVGAILQGRVVRLMPYGVFVELIPGVEGMVHVSELSWSRVENPADVCQPGDAITVKVIGIEAGSRSDQKKIALSVKQASSDPWEQELGFAPGDKVTGKVIRCMNFGAFVEIAPGIEGLIHISELSYTRRVLKVEEVLKPGETATVMIKEIDPGARRISLSLRDAEGDPWQEIPENFAIGQSIEGTLQKKEKFGFFVSLAPGIDGLLPKSKMSRSSQAAELDKLKAGDPITVKIAEINTAERKITLAPAQAADESDWRNFTADSGKSLGSLGEKLQQALKSGKKNK